MGHHQNVTIVRLPTDVIHKRGRSLIDVLERFPPIGPGIDVDHPIVSNTGDALVQPVRGRPLRCSEAPLPQEWIGPYR
jgi:hypothetical protein